MSAFSDDYLTLVAPEDRAAAQAVAERCISAEAFFADALALAGRFARLEARISADSIARALSSEGALGHGGFAALVAGDPGRGRAGDEYRLLWRGGQLRL